MDFSTISISNTLSKENVDEELSMFHASMEDAQKRLAEEIKPGTISNERIQKGDEILETYQVTSDAIYGGMGSVWRVLHRKMKRTLIALLILALMTFAACGNQQHQTPVPSGDASESESASGSEGETAAELETGIERINKYGNITLTIGPESMRELGYEPADVILVRIGGEEVEMPVGTAYSDVDSGEPVCTFKTDSSEGREEVVLAINAGNFASAIGIAEIRSIDTDPGYEILWSEGFDQTTAVYLSLVEKQGYAEEYRIHQIVGTRSNDRGDYPRLTDAEYANFREVKTTGMGKGTLFRSSTPIDPSLNRNKEADDLVLDSLIHTIINMTDSEETMKAYSDYSLTNYSKCDILALNMGMDFQSADFKEKLARGFRYVASNKGPYLIHCKEGKDRTGFAAAILECLMGADMDEIVEDYMLTYFNFYGVEPGSEQYLQIAESNIKKTLALHLGIESINDENVDLAECASKYLKSLGMTEEEISSLRNNLSEDYGGMEQ